MTRSSALHDSHWEFVHAMSSHTVRGCRMHQITNPWDAAWQLSVSCREPQNTGTKHWNGNPWKWKSQNHKSVLTVWELEFSSWAPWWARTHGATFAWWQSYSQQTLTFLYLLCSKGEGGIVSKSTPISGSSVILVIQPECRAHFGICWEHAWARFRASHTDMRKWCFGGCVACTAAKPSTQDKKTSSRSNQSLLHTVAQTTEEAIEHYHGASSRNSQHHKGCCLRVKHSYVSQPRGPNVIELLPPNPIYRTVRKLAENSWTLTASSC